MHTGEKIRLVRMLKGFSQENMAEMLKLSRQAYGDIERGKTDVTDMRLEQIAEVLQVSPNDILELPDKLAIIFDQCNGVIGLNTGNQHNYYDQRELQHQLEKAQLEIEKLKLEVAHYRLERDKVLLETQLGQHKRTE
jgi:transcriptional regulator with XRE-family HTH domain